MTAFIFLILFIILCIAGIIRLWRGSSDSGMWDGPPQTKEQQKEGSRWMTDHLAEFPNTPYLAGQYPKEYNKAQAMRRYYELEKLREADRIDEIDYQLELEKILPLIDISDLEEK